MNTNNKTGLFKYLAPSKLDFFEKLLLQLTPPIYFNDPWDFRPRFRTLAEEEIKEVWRETESRIANLPSVPGSTDPQFREDGGLLDILRVGLLADAFRLGQSENYQAEIGKVVGIISLTELPLCRLMWAHYADSHKGFVVELAAGELEEWNGFAIRRLGTNITAGKVQYPQKFSAIELERDGKNVLDVCWSKHPSWEYEQEWRIVAPLSKSLSRRNRFCAPIRPSQIVRVIFGMRMEEAQRQRLLSVLEAAELKHVQRQMTTIDAQTGELGLIAL